MYPRLSSETRIERLYWQNGAYATSRSTSEETICTAFTRRSRSLSRSMALGYLYIRFQISYYIIDYLIDDNFYFKAMNQSIETINSAAIRLVLVTVIV